MANPSTFTSGRGSAQMSSVGRMSAYEAPDIETSSADYARRFAGKAGRYLLQEQTRAVIAVLGGLSPGSALDVGGGHGQLVEPLTSLGWSVTVHGSDDVCARNLRELHGKHSCTFVRGDIYSLPFADRSFDLVIAVRLLAHVADWRRLLAEMCRIARIAVAIEYPSKAALNAVSPALFNFKKRIEGNTRTYASFWPEELTAQLRSLGFVPRAEVKELCLPLVLHRALKGSPSLRLAESAMRAVGLTKLIGSPVILRGDRQVQD